MKKYNDESLTGLVVLKFTAEWCAPCKRLNPILQKLSEETPEVTFYEVDVDEMPTLSDTYKVKSVPTLVFLKEGVEIKRHVGLSLIDPLRKVLREMRDE